MRCLASVIMVGLGLVVSAPVMANPIADTAANPLAAAAGSAPTAPATPTATATTAPAPATPAPAKPVVTLEASIDLAAQTATIRAHGKTVGVWKISSGVEQFATPTGTFKPDWMAKMWFSKQYDDAPMPHAVFFKNGAAIHATQSTHALGRPASHGCVRLAPANAKTFYGLVQKHGLAATRIKVFGTPNYPARVAASPANSPTQSRAPAVRYRQAPPPPATYVQKPSAVSSLFGAPTMRWPGDPVRPR